MRGGYYFPKGRKTGRVWVSWKGKKIFVNKYLDETPLYHEEQCKRVLERMRSEIDEGIFDPSVWGKDKTLLFQNAWNLYQEQSPCGQARHDDRERIYNDFILPYFRDRSLKEIEETHIADWLSKLPKYSPAYLKLLRNTLRAFFNHFSITRRKVFKYPQIKLEKKATPWLTEEEQEKVLTFIPPQHQGILRLIKAYGCRPSEACNLKKADIDWDKKIIIFRERKNLEDNTLPILPEIERYLVGASRASRKNADPNDCIRSEGMSDLVPPISEKYLMGGGEKANRRKVMGQGNMDKIPPEIRHDNPSLNLNPVHPSIVNLHYVFCTLRGHKYRRQYLYQIWHRANIKAHNQYGIKVLPLKNATRHSKASQLLERGVDIGTIARILGNSPGVVEKTYARMGIQKVIGILEGK